VRIQFGTDGFPAVAYTCYYSSGQPNELRFVHCTSVDCSIFDAPIVLETATTSHSFFRMDFKIGSDGYPIIWWDLQNGVLHSVHCTSVDCSTMSPIVTFSLPNTPAWSHLQYLSIEIGTDTLPVGVYTSTASQYTDVNVIHCSTVDCSSYTATQLTTGGGNRGPDLTIASNGYPIISYLYEIGGTSYAATISCNNVLCTSYGSPQTLQSPTSALDSTGILNVIFSCLLFLFF